MREIEALNFIQKTDTLRVANIKAREAVGVAIKALDKQIPKKPSYEGDGEYNGQIVYDTWICPCCEKRYEVDYDSYDYCPNCGQHIDHSGLTEDD